MTRVQPFRRPVVWAISLGWWSVVGLLNAGSEVIDIITGDQRLPYWQPVVWELTSTFVFALLTPFLVTFTLFAQGRPRRVWLLLHAGGAAAFSLLHVVGMVALRKAIYRIASSEYHFGHWGWELLYESFKDVVTYAAMVGLILGIEFYRRYRERELAASRLEASLARARLDNLEQQIQPHFLFNTLNMISSIMHEDVAQADRMITRLSDLLRLAVQSRGTLEVTVEDEITLLRTYLDIMHARFEDKLVVDVQVPDEVRGGRMPPLLLQPLVENAIKHGMTGRDRLRVDVGVTRSGDHLVVSVVDDGPGIVGDPGDLLAQGVGLSSTAERLEGLYGEDHTLELYNRDDGGLSVTIRLPFHTERDRP